MKTLFLIFSSCLCSLILFGQNTIGVLNNSIKAHDAFTLYAPVSYTSTYLIDNCGRVINQWDSEYDPGLVAYLLPGGRLLRTGRETESGNFPGAGKGGIIQIFDWEGNIEWEALVSDNQFGAHHDIEYLPSGNILVLRWEKKFDFELIQAGKNPNFTPAELWIPSIIEIKPVGTEDFDVVWEWHLFDHLVQDYDPAKDNFGIISENPRKVDLNYNNITERDWGHLNCIDFNIERNEILLSSRNLDEVWVIDHSTTSQQAASDIGGNSNLGGQLLYRFGNASVYQDSLEVSFLDGQHDAEFKLLPDNSIPCIQLFNNNNENFKTSEFVEFVPKLDGDGNYALENNRFDTVGVPIVFDGGVEGNFNSTIMSSVQALPNGNLLVNSGRTSKFIEFDSLGNEVWRYVGPVSIFGPNEQGSNIVGSTFRIEKFSITNPIFDTLDISIKADAIELSPSLTNCGLTSTTSIFPLEANIYPNPFNNYFTIEGPGLDEVDLEIYSSLGALVLKKEIKSGEQLDATFLQSGFYLIKLKEDESEATFKMIKI